MTGLPTLDPEVADLGVAIGLLTSGSGGVQLDSSWFDAPAERLAGTLADDTRRGALVRFGEAVLASGTHDEQDGVTLLDLFNLRRLAGDDSLPDLTVQASLDARPPDHIEIGIAATLVTTNPATTTELRAPLYRAAKAGRTVSQPFALLAGGVVHLATDLTLSAVPPAPDEFGLAGVQVAVDTALSGGAASAFQLVLKGLHLPGTATQDLAIGGPGQGLEQTLLSLVLGVVRQGAESLTGPAAAPVQAALDLFGLGQAPGIPPLPVDDLIEHGAARLRDWFTDLAATAAAREAWLGALAGLLGGSVATGPDGPLAEIPLPGSPVTAELGFTAVTGSHGHLVVTPRLSLRVTADAAGAVRLGAEAVADLVTIDTSSGSLAALPHVEVVATATGSGAGPAARLFTSGPFSLTAARVGLSVEHGSPQALVQLRGADLDGQHHEVLDLSTPGAVVAAIGEVAAHLLTTALDALGDAGAELAGLLGLVPTGGMPALDAAKLLSDPLGALADWWHDLFGTHPADVPAVLARLRNLVAGPAQVGVDVAVADPGTGPWSIPIVDHVTVDVALADGNVTVEPVMSFQVDTLAAGCTSVRTEVRTRLLTIDLAARHATFGLQTELLARMQARGEDEARLSLGPVAVAADYIGVRAGWNPQTGFAFGLETPNLAIDTGSGRIPLALPTLDASGHLNVPDEAWTAVETLLGVLAANTPLGWFADLADLAGWNVVGTVRGPGLSLRDLATAPGPALQAWLRALATDTDLLGSLTATVAHLTGGSADALTGAFSGSGTPQDPWLASLSPADDGPALSVWLSPHGPVTAPSRAGTAITTWRPGVPGLTPDGLAQAVFDEALAGADVAALAAGRAGLGTGLAALAGRWAGTDGLAGPPADPVDGLTVDRRPNLDHTGLAGLDVAALLPAGLPDGAVVVRVAVASATAPPWPPAPGRLIDLTTPGVAPESFTVEAPADGEWVVALAPRADASLGSVEDPSGLAGQSARLQQVLTRLVTAGPVVLVALGGAGHAARMAADAVSGVTYLVTLGTPWSPVTFDSARTGGPADALRLLKALLPEPDAAEPDDPDLALGRHLVDGFFAAARGGVTVTELEAPRPTVAVRAGLTAVAVFGVLGPGAVARAMTAVVAAGLAGRAQARLAETAAAPEAAHVAVRLPFDLLTPPGGHGITLQGSIALHLGAVQAADSSPAAEAAVLVDLTLADTDGWLLGGPGVAPVGGALPLELRRLEARVQVGLHGGTSVAELALHEGAALGADFTLLHIAPSTATPGEIETQPILPEARALLGALTAKLAGQAPASPARLTASLLAATGVTTPDGALVPDALLHLLHEPGTHVADLVGVPAGRLALMAALAALVPGITADGDTLHVAAGPLTADADFAARTVALTASAAAGTGVLAWAAGADVDAAGHLAVTVRLGDPATDALALSVGSSPAPHAQLLRPAGRTPVPLFPSPDLDGLAALALAAIPAEGVRILLEGLRRLDAQLGQVLDALADALGILKPADPSGVRAIAAPLGLFEDPGGWMRSVLGLAGGGLDADKVIDLFECLKPFLGLLGTPRGQWPIVEGVTVTAASGPSGPSLALAIDATTWLAGLAGRAEVAAGLTVGLTLPPGGAARPSAEIFLGVPDGPGGTTTAQHRRAAHLLVDDSHLRILLRPAAGADIEVYPNTAGLGALFATGITEVLPLALNRLAALSGDEVRTEIAALVGAVGRGLAVATGSPAVFDSAALKTLAADPAAYLRARLVGLLAEAVAALDPVLVRLLGLAAGQHAAVVDAAGVLTVTVREATLQVHPSPLSVSLTAAATGLPVVGTAEVSVTVDGTGLAGWSAAVGPATLDLDGPVVRPFARVAASASSGWEAGVGLGLDALPAGTDGHQELTARWRQASGLGVLVTTRTGPALAEDGSPEALATAAIDAVLDLVGGWVLGVGDVQDLLTRAVGSGGKTVKDVLEGSILAPGDPPRLLPATLSGWPVKLLTMAGQLAAAAPSVTVGPFMISVTSADGVLGVSLSALNAAGIDLTPNGELTLHLEVDASWIEPPGAPAPTPGVVLNLLRVSAAGVDPAPGIAVNGVGLRLAKSTGPLIDAGLKLDSMAVHVLGSVALGTGGQPQRAGGIEVELSGLAVPLGGGGGGNAVAKGILHDAGGSGAPPRPAFSPALAVQDHGTGVAVTLRAGSGNGPWFLPIQRAFGPVYLEQVGLGVTYRQGLTPRQLQMISLYLDGRVSLLGLTAAVDKLRLGYDVTRPIFSPSSWEVDVDGFAIAADFGSLTLSGGLAKFPLDPAGVEYLGMLKIGYGSYGLDLFGGYAHPTTPGGGEFASFFAFGVLHAPIGGPPAFFVTGIGLGFGINRALRTPTIDQIDTNPFMVALRATGPTPDPMTQLRDLRAALPPAQGQYWISAGVSFTSFVLITGEVLVMVQFGDGLEVAVVGMARALLPTAELTLVSIELALLARFSTKEGLMLIQAQLTENSWLLDKSVRLTGGFAFETWWKGPNAGQFVVTVGGYHPRFHHDGYPDVPRVGLSWQPNDNISITGGVYFALCSEAIMAGASMHVAAHLGPAHATLDFGGDGIVFFDPFFFDITVYAEARVGITIWLLFGSIDVDVTLGFDVEVSGPPIHVKGHFSVYGVGIPFEFGQTSDPADRALSAGDFAQKYLRGDKGAQVVQAGVIRGGLTAGRSPAPGSGGVAKPPDGSAALPFRVVPEFVMSFVTTVPSQRLALTCAAGTHTEALATPGLGVAPMYAATMTSSLTVTLTSDSGQAIDLDGIALTLRPAAAFPKGVWGPAQNPKAKTVPSGDTVDACDGFALDTRLPESRFTGAPQIDYHQVELPLHGRKPLPFVTNRPQTDARVAAAVALNDAAKVLDAGDPGTDERFVRAALMMAAARNGQTTVAALRGERSSAPTFGSLADDLVDSPDAVSTPVTPVVVDRAPPAPPRLPPIVRSVLGVPLALTLERPAQTTVKDPGSAQALPVPRLAEVRAATAGLSQLSLHLVPRAARPDGATLSAAGTTPLTRLASGTLGSVTNARPSPAATERLASMSAALVPPAGASAPKAPASRARRATARGAQAVPGGAIVHDGELVVVTVAPRLTDGPADTLTVTGSGLTRVLSLAAGGRVLDDRVAGTDGSAQAIVQLPASTERIVVVGLGTQAAAGGSLPGWYAGQSLPSVGWDTALGSGAVVTAQGTRVPDNRERGDSGWVGGRELASAALVATTFTDPVNVVAVVVDDKLGGDAAAEVSIRLTDATRALDAGGAPQPPQALVDGVRTILLYPVETVGPNPRVVVEGCSRGQLAGVLGSAAGLASVAQSLVTTGVAAAVRQPLVGGPGVRLVSVTPGDGTTPSAPATASPRKAARKATAKTAEKAATGQATRKSAKKTAKKGGRR